MKAPKIIHSIAAKQVPLCIKYVQCRLRETLCSASLSFYCTPSVRTMDVLQVCFSLYPTPSACTMDVLQVCLSLYPTPSACTAHTLYRVSTVVHFCTCCEWSMRGTNKYKLYKQTTWMEIYVTESGRRG